MSIKKVIQYGDQTLTMETGEIARQADGAVMIRLGDTALLVTCVARKEADPGRDFFPLTVNYQERTYSAGKIPGGFFKREGRPSEKETLTSRLIDRPLRPLFPKGFINEVQVIATVISLDPAIGPGYRSRHPRHDRRLRSRVSRWCAFQWPHCWRARGLQGW